MRLPPLKPSRFPRLQKGFTLFEVMVSLSIIVLLLGLAATVISRLTYRWGFEANIMRTQSIIRAARNFSLNNETCSEVHVIPLENRIFALGEKTVAQWHFENTAGDEVEGAFGMICEVNNAIVTQGKTGQGLEFGTMEGLEVRDSYVDCGNLPVFNPPAGIVFDLWIFPGDFRGDAYKQLIGLLQGSDEDDDESPPDDEEIEEEARRRAQQEITLKEKLKKEQRFSILYKEGSYVLSLTENYALEFSFGYTAVTNYYQLRTLDNVVSPNMWNHIVLRYCGIIEYPPDKVKLFINGVPVTVFFIDTRTSVYTLKYIADIDRRDKEYMLPVRLPEIDSNLYISDIEESFYGVIDDVRIAAIVDPEIDKLDSAFLMGYPQIIYFDSQGRLDPERHEADAIITLTENAMYRAPKLETEELENVSRAGGMSGPISAEEALKNVERKQPVAPEMYKHAVITVNRYGKIELEQLVEEEKEEEE